MATWIKFVEEPPKPKTRVWLVYPTSLKSQIPLGRVAWYGPWRKYCFFPEEFTVFEQVCLREIAEFCEQQTAEHKAAK